MKSIVEITEKSVNGVPVFGIHIQSADEEYKYNGLTEIKSEAEELCRRLKDGEVSAVHYDDIVRDFIMGKACDRLSINNL